MGILILTSLIIREVLNSCFSWAQNMDEHMTLYLNTQCGESVTVSGSTEPVSVEIMLTKVHLHVLKFFIKCFTNAKMQRLTSAHTHSHTQTPKILLSQQIRTKI